MIRQLVCRKTKKSVIPSNFCMIRSKRALKKEGKWSVLQGLLDQTRICAISCPRLHRQLSTVFLEVIFHIVLILQVMYSQVAEILDIETVFWGKLEEEIGAFQLCPVWGSGGTKRTQTNSCTYQSLQKNLHTFFLELEFQDVRNAHIRLVHLEILTYVNFCIVHMFVRRFTYVQIQLMKSTGKKEEKKGEKII